MSVTTSIGPDRRLCARLKRAHSGHLQPVRTSRRSASRWAGHLQAASLAESLRLPTLLSLRQTIRRYISTAVRIMGQVIHHSGERIRRLVPKFHSGTPKETRTALTPLPFAVSRLLPPGTRRFRQMRYGPPSRWHQRQFGGQGCACLDSRHHSGLGRE
jgi:hypothetical protein